MHSYNDHNILSELNNDDCIINHLIHYALLFHLIEIEHVILILTWIIIYVSLIQLHKIINIKTKMVTH